MIESARLYDTVQALRSGELDLLDYIEMVYGRLMFDAQVESLLPEPERYQRLMRAALELRKRFPEPGSRPPLYGIVVGVKDIFCVDGFPTHAGSRLPVELFEGAEASSVTALREAGALVLGKTVTTEFAYFEPNQTRNPHQLAHTPGGSSSGSAAAVSAGFCPLALGTQTIGSIIRPAAYCGVVGFKPSYGRIPTDGVIPISTALDHIGLFTQDVAGMELAASVLCGGWQPVADAETLPTLGVPAGAYLEQASPEALAVFEQHVALLEGTGYRVKRVPLLGDIATVSDQTFRIMAAEMSDAHRDWFPPYEALYRPRTEAMIRRGLAVTPDQRQQDLQMQRETRAAIAVAMAENSIDLWITPAATSAAPLGLESTGSPAMNLPWTLIGFPSVALPTASRTPDGLPFGLQVVAGAMADERLLRWCAGMSAALNA